MSTIIIGGIVIGAMILVTINLIKKRKSSSCGCGCSGCGKQSECHK